MKVNAKITIWFGVALAVFTALFLACFLRFSTAGGAQNDVDRGAEKDSHLSPKVERVDLGDGISLKKWVLESESGEVRARSSTITRDGETLMMVFWQQESGNAAGQTLVRSYWCGGNVVLTEGDDGSGSDLLVMHGDDGMPVQAVEEKKDGAVVPVSSERITKMQEEYGFLRDIMTSIAEGAKTAVSEQERQRLIDDAVRKAKKGIGDLDNQ